ncbi:MAG: excinuclease ABC subunit UvrA [Clostridia bacterium]|nr:excinuclease ABC subunit UvrA [Clostridia bacterium]
MRENIYIKGAREHNLKNIDIEIPRDNLVVITGLSGSGKSSLAFDTIYAEGQRRYVESLSSYARMFLGQMDKPDVDYIEGLSPAISIDQKTTSRNPRSTVGTVTEIYDYLRLLYARIGVVHCPVCHKEIKQQSVDEIVDKVLKFPDGTKFQVLAPLVRARKGEHVKLLNDAAKSGYVRAKVDGIMYELTDKIPMDKNKKHDVSIVIDRLVKKDNMQKRLTDSIETALKLASGNVIIDIVDQEEMLFSQNYACPNCGINIEELTPRMFSFNSPFGACPHCTGLGEQLKIDPDQVVPDKNKSLLEGAIVASGWNTADNPKSMAYMYYSALAKHYGFKLTTPFKDIPKEYQDKLLYGTGNEKIKFEYQREYSGGTYFARFEGVITNIERRHNETTSEAQKAELETQMVNMVCPECEGKRLKRESLAVTVGGKNIIELTDMSISDALNFIKSLKLSEKEKIIADMILKEIISRLGFLVNVGLDYLTLSRGARTLSGGEAQRIRLATQIGSSLMGVLYILDEPSIGLHQKDNDKLIATLKNLRDLGNSVIVVEHDEETMREADYIIDIGPGAGIHGGNIVYAGSVEKIVDCVDSITGQYLSGRIKIEIPEKRREVTDKRIKIVGACENNLKNIDVEIPLGVMTVVTGVSGSGKSTLINEILYKTLATKLNRARKKSGNVKDILGIEYLDKVIQIDQSPIGRTPRSNPATYTGLFNDIRDLYASTQEAQARGYKPGRFSFNVKGGRCEACMGDGIIKIEMHFLPDVFVPCEVCKGKRYNRETLEVKYKGKNISEVLDMTVEEALYFFENIPSIKRKLQTLFDVGLGYVKIGQPATTLSGGESQRVKLATELSKRSTGKTSYILDEPTTGLHSADVHKLEEVLQKLVDAGNTVIIIEHNLDVIKCADYIIDMGPDGGNNGGTVVVCGTPEQVAQCKKSYTGQYLKRILK